MRVLMTADTAGGVWSYALSLCKALGGRGTSTHLIALGTVSPEQSRQASAISHLQLTEKKVPLEWMSDPWDPLDQFFDELCTIAQAEGPDIVHLNHLVHGHLPVDAPVICAVHSCVLSWFEAVRQSAPPDDWNEYRERTRYSLGHADHVIAPSRWMLERAKAFYGPFRAATAIANGSDAPLDSPGTLRHGVIAAGRVWDEAKNLEALARTCSEMSEPLQIVGPREDPSAHEASADEPSPQESQCLAGSQITTGPLPQHELFSRMRQAKVFAAPALYEPFGLGVLEAARSGCALVLSDIPTFRDIWDGAALFIDPRDPPAWPAVIDRLLQDDAERLALANAARQRSISFDMDTCAAAHDSLYRTIHRTRAVAS